MPKLSQNERTTFETYNQTADLHAKAVQRADHWLLERTTFLNNLLFLGEKYNRNFANASILDLGCGVGQDGIRFSGYNFRYVGIDASDGMLRKAKETNSHLTYVRMFAQELALASNVFDGVWAVNIMHHIQRDRVKDALSEMYRVMKVGGVGYISFIEGTGQAMIPTYGAEQHATLLTAHNEGEARHLLKKTQFLVEKIEKIHPHLLFTVVKDKPSK